MKIMKYTHFPPLLCHLFSTLFGRRKGFVDQPEFVRLDPLNILDGFLSDKRCHIKHRAYLTDSIDSLVMYRTTSTSRSCPMR